MTKKIKAMKHFLATSIVALLTPGIIFAQGVSVSKDKLELMGFDNIDEEATVTKWKQDETQNLQLFLLCQVDDVDRVCSLNADQLDKLNLLCKGIVVRRIRAGEDQYDDLCA